MNNTLLAIVIVSLALISCVILLIYDIVQYNKERKKLRELISAILNGDDEEDVEFKNIEELAGQGEGSEAAYKKEPERGCKDCKQCEEREPLDKAHAFDNGCVRWE